MEPRVCPECGAKNDPGEPQCLNCNLVFPRKPEVGLVGGPASIQADPTPPEPQPEYVPPPPPPPTESYAQSRPPGRGAGGFGALNASQPVAGLPQSARYQRLANSDDGVNWRVVALVVMVLSCSTFAAWWFFLRPPCPADTISRLIGAVEAGDYAAAKSCFTNSSLALLGVPSGNTGMAGGFVRTSARLNIRVVGTSYEGTQSEIAIVECEPTDGANMPPGITIRFQLVVLQEEGDWKIDVGKTLERARRQTSAQVRPSGG